MAKKKQENQEFPKEILEKHRIGLELARKYWVLNEPTAFSDKDFDSLERLARQDGLELRDYVYREIQGTRFQNAPYIIKVDKVQVTGDMLDAIKEFTEKYRSETSQDLYWIPKYDGSSLAGYYDTTTGQCKRVVTIGGSNLGSEGIDQTKKFARYFPNLPGSGICAIQAECMISMEHGYGDSSRQKANGLVNSKYQENEVDSLANLRGFRYFLDPESEYSLSTSKLNYREIMNSIPQCYNLSGDCKFSTGYVLTLDKLESLGPEIVNKDLWKTPTGTFLIDGMVAYTKEGVCLKALKYKDAGRGEATEVLGIKWNNQISKGKDSWSANALINPVVVRGSTCTKPTVGSVKKMVASGLSKGAKVNVILANSTIPQVSTVIEKGNLDFQWPTCSCGYKMSEKDIYAALLKCGNPRCTERTNRMRSYLESLSDFSQIDLDQLLIIDRFKWKEKSDPLVILPDIYNICKKDLGITVLEECLRKYLSTNLQRNNLALVMWPAYKTLREFICYRKNH